MTVSKIRNGNTRVGYVTLKKVVEARTIGSALLLEQPLPLRDISACDNE